MLKSDGVVVTNVWAVGESCFLFEFVKGDALLFLSLVEGAICSCCSDFVPAALSYGSIKLDHINAAINSCLG